jgi:hypothetical protein
MKPTDSNRLLLQREWLLRLLREETKTQRSLLRSKDSFCCLGDLLDTAVKLKAEGVSCSKEGPDYTYIFHGTSSEVALPKDFAEVWLDFPSYIIEPTTGEIILPSPFEDPIEGEESIHGFSVLASPDNFPRRMELANLNDSGLAKGIIGVILWAVYIPPFSYRSATLRPNILKELNLIVRNYARNPQKRNTVLEWKLRQYVQPIIGRLESQSQSYN